MGFTKRVSFTEIVLITFFFKKISSTAKVTFSFENTKGMRKKIWEKLLFFKE